MKYKSKDIEHAIHKYVQQYGSVYAVPAKLWKPFRDDFARDSQASHHYFEDENTYFWNTPLKTCRTKLYNVGKLLREPNSHKRLKVLKKLHITISGYNNTVYQCHMCHRCYEYKARGHKPIYASFRDELMQGIKENNLPGPQTQTELSYIFHNHGNYRPNPHGKIIGHATKMFTYRQLEYFSNKTMLEDNRPSIVLPFERVYHKNV